MFTGYKIDHWLRKLTGKKIWEKKQSKTKMNVEKEYLKHAEATDVDKVPTDPVAYGGPQYI